MPGIFQTVNTPAMHSDGPVLAELFLGFVHLAEEVDEALAALGDALLWPVCKLELPNRPGGAVTGVCHLRRNKDKLG